MRDDDDGGVSTLLDIMARLRDPQHGCPWDLAQDFASIAPYTIEEAYEVADAIVRGDMHDLCDELGDLLFQVVFHARMAEEDGAFAFADVASAISRKMLRRHPHVFAQAEAEDAQAVRRSWESIKARERAETGRARGSAMDGVAAGMSPMSRALKLQRRAAAVGFDWSEAAAVLDKVREELGELEHEIEGERRRARLEAEVGDLLFSAINLARHLEIDPERALIGTSQRFESRFRRMERVDGAPLSALGPEELEARWRAAKAEEEGDGQLSRPTRQGAG